MNEPYYNDPWIAQNDQSSTIQKLVEDNNDLWERLGRVCEVEKKLEKELHDLQKKFLTPLIDTLLTEDIWISSTTLQITDFLDKNCKSFPFGFIYSRKSSPDTYGNSILYNFIQLSRHEDDPSWRFYLSKTKNRDNE